MTRRYIAPRPRFYLRRRHAVALMIAVLLAIPAWVLLFAVVRP